MKTGLVLGKFAPLHKGHQLLIDTALAENDRVIVMIYDAPETSVPLPVRGGWIRKLYNNVELIEARDGPTETGDTPQIIDGENIANFYSSDIDPERSRIPVSAMQIRQDPYAFRKYLDPLVYRDLIIRVAFMGAPSTGKTSLAEALASRYETVWMPEYGREYWLEHQQNRRLSPEQLLDIAQGHIEREERLFIEARQYLFVDTEAITTWHFALDYHGTAHPELERLAGAAEKRYDLFFLCNDDIPFDDTWERSGLQHRRLFQQQIRTDLIRRHIPFITVSGSLEQRMEKVCSVLDGFDRYGSTGDHLLGLSHSN